MTLFFLGLFCAGCPEPPHLDPYIPSSREDASGHDVVDMDTASSWDSAATDVTGIDSARPDRWHDAGPNPDAAVSDTAPAPDTGHAWDAAAAVDGAPIVPCLTGPAATVNIPAVQILLDVTLNGAPVSSANSSGDDEGQLILENVTSGERSALGGVWDDALDQPLTPMNLHIVPGIYDIYYGVIDDGPHWPSNTNALLLAGVNMNVDGALTVDVPVVNIVIDVTLNGAAISADNSGDHDEGELILVDAATGERSGLGGVWDDNLDQPLTPYNLHIVPGSYDIYYGVIDDGPHWPSNTNALLLSNVSMSSSGSLAVNVSTVNISLDVTLNGMGITAANTGDDDEGQLILQNTATLERSELEGVWHDTQDQPLTPYDLQIIPDTYDIYYGVVDDGPNWPSNTNVLLRSAVALTSSGVLTVDIPSVHVSLDVTLNQAAITSANSGDNDEGQLVLVDPTTGERSELGGVWDDNSDQPLTPYDLRIVPGTYDIYYAVVDDGPHWPSNTNAKVRSAVSLQASGSLSVDIPTASITLDVTLDGATISAANSGDDNEGQLVLVDPTSGERSELGGVWDDNNNLPLTPYDLKIVPGSYDIYYAVVDDGPDWPANTNALLRQGVGLTTSGALTVDVPVATLALDVTLDGAQLSSNNCGDQNEGQLVLVDPNSGERSELGGVWDDNSDSVLTPYQLSIIPGRYDIYYAIVDEGPDWPANTNARLGCLNAQ